MYLRVLVFLVASLLVGGCVGQGALASTPEVGTPSTSEPAQVSTSAVEIRIVEEDDALPLFAQVLPKVNVGEGEGDALLISKEYLFRASYDEAIRSWLHNEVFERVLMVYGCSDVRQVAEILSLEEKPASSNPATLKYIAVALHAVDTPGVEDDLLISGGVMVSSEDNVDNLLQELKDYVIKIQGQIEQ